LSIPVIRCPLSNNLSAKCEPRKPATPVIRIDFDKSVVIKKPKLAKME
jgi:hypothetical protein